MLYTIFDTAVTEIRNSTINLAADTFYCRLLSATPPQNAAVVSDLTETTYPGYTPVLVSGNSYTGGVWKFADISFPACTSGSFSVIGMAICKRLGASPASTDRTVLYRQFVNNGVPYAITLTTGQAIRCVIDQVAGVHSINAWNRYTVGNYASDLDTFGAFYMLGTSNGTTTFANPETAKILPLLESTSTIITANVTIANRSLASPNLAANAITVPTTKKLFLSFVGNRTYEPSTNSVLRIYHANTVSSSYSIQIYGAKYLPAYSNGSAIPNEALYFDLIGAGSFNGSGNISTVLAHNIPLSASSAEYKYLAIKSTAAADLRIVELELYGGIINSQNSNLT